MSDAMRRVFILAGGAAPLAHRCGVSPQAVYKWLKRGWVSPDRATQLCRWYGVPAADLIRPELRRVLALHERVTDASDLI